MNPFINYPTVFIDLDGTIFKHTNFGEGYSFEAEPTIGAVEKLKEWKKNGYCIVLTTARDEYHRVGTMKQLAINDIPWDQLIMGIGSGKRWLINDTKPWTNDTAEAVIVERNKGLSHVNINSPIR